MFTPRFWKVNTVPGPFRTPKENLQGHQLLNDSQSILFSLFPLWRASLTVRRPWRQHPNTGKCDKIISIISICYNLYPFHGLGARAL